MIKLKILGGHGGISLGFKGTSYLIDDSLLIDAGGVVDSLTIEEQLKIDTILISHPHLDHIKDLAFLSDNCFGMKNGPFEVFSSVGTREAIKNHLMNDQIWPDFSKLPSVEKPTMRFHIFEPDKVLHIKEYKIVPILVNHPGMACGFIIEKGDSAILFTQDTGPTYEIWEKAKTYKNLKAIFSEVSFPNEMKYVAKLSCHHTPQTIEEEIKKMPTNIPIYLGHIKPNYQKTVMQEIAELNNKRIQLLEHDDLTFEF